jgi:hypothetical protein
VVHGSEVYGEPCDGLVREIARLGGGDEVSDLLNERFNPWLKPDVAALADLLVEMRDRVYADAKERGWDV